MGEVYVPNPRHKVPWQPGARGTLCPGDVDAETLFREATEDPQSPGKRFNTDGSHAYCAHPDNVVDQHGNEIWHGFPIEWKRVPPTIRRKWVREGRIPNRLQRG